MSSINSSPLPPLPVQAGNHLPSRPIKLPRLITRAAGSHADMPRVTAVTVDAHRSSAHILPTPHVPAKPETAVYQTLQSATRFAIIIPLSIQTASFQPLVEKHTGIAVVRSSPRLKRGITIQRLGMQTPSPPWAVRYMSTRGGGRFSLMSRVEFHRPASERLAVQHMEGNDECLNVMPQGTRTEHTFDNEFAPEKLKVIKYLVAQRISPHRLETMEPLKQALHNVLARAVSLKAPTRTSIQPKRRVRDSRPGSAKPESSQHMRRTRPAIAPLDMDAVHSYKSTNSITESPPESPGPKTPTDDPAVSRKDSKEACTSKDKVVASSKSRQKVVGSSVVYSVNWTGQHLYL
ncbi:hypothetical protein FRC10_006746 [Ceratobasidium sp. 414]|nr:hypothetical protein FRC10_006746 [Ceratobasidium sp. 414]